MIRNRVQVLNRLLAECVAGCFFVSAFRFFKIQFLLKLLAKLQELLGSVVFLRGNGVILDLVEIGRRINALFVELGRPSLFRANVATDGIRDVVSGRERTTKAIISTVGARRFRSVRFELWMFLLP